MTVPCCFFTTLRSLDLNLSMVRKGEHLKSLTTKGGDSVRTLTVSALKCPYPEVKVLFRDSLYMHIPFHGGACCACDHSFPPQSFLSDDDNARFLENASWLDAEELTTPTSTTEPKQSFTLQNTNFDDTTADDGGLHLEMGENQMVVKPVTGHKTSNF